MVVVLYAQITPTQVVEAGNDAIANNDIEFMANNDSAEAKTQKFYPAAKTGGTASTTHDVRFYINDADLNTVKKGRTVWAGANGGTAIAADRNWNLDEDEGAGGHANVLLETAGEGADHTTVAGSIATAVENSDNDGTYNTASAPKTALVANTLNLSQGSVNLTFSIDAQNDTDGTFSVSGITTVGDGVGAADHVVAAYDFNSVDAYAVATKRAKVTSTSDATGEWVALAEIAAITGTAAAIDSKYSTGTIQVGPDASHAAAGNSVVWVQDGDTLTVTYYGAGTDSNGDGSIADSEVGAVIATTTATIDDSAPSISNVSPADGTLTKDTAPEITFTIEDGGSGLGAAVGTLGAHVDVFIGECLVTDGELNVRSFDSKKIEVVYTPPVSLKYSDNAGTSANTNAATIDCAEAVADQADRGALRVQGGYEINSVADTADTTNKRTHDGTEFSWKIVATDAAGNAKTLGATSGASDLNVIIDSESPLATPTITAAKAWDAGDKKDISDNSSVKIAFNESIDSATVETSDFTVSGVGVTSSTIETVTVGGTAALTGTQIYLSLAADLGPNAKPKVKLVGQISDLAGNVLKPSSVQTTGITLGTATDGVKPTLSGMALGDLLLSDKETTKFTYAGNENMTNTSQTLAQGCTCGSVSGTNTATADLTTAAADTTKLTVSLTSPTAGTANVKETTAPFNSDGIYGIVAVGLDAADNKGIGGITKVTDEDISKYFVDGTGELLGAGHVTDAILNADADKIKVKLAKWPLADSDGDGELSDEIVGLTVNGNALTAAELLGLKIIHADFGEAETISIESEDISVAAVQETDGFIGAGDTIKITYYYVNATSTVEVDTTAPGASYSPSDGTSTTDTTPSLSVTWDDDEYAGDTQKTVTLTKADLKDPDGVTTSILAEMTSTDDISFYYKPTVALALGEYKLTFKAEDVAGNKSSDKSFKVAIKARSKSSITMSPGWNLISLPGEPADGAINSVISSSQVDTVLTYDPSTPGGWLTAVRDGDALVGTLETMDASHAYWVMSNNSDPIKVEIPGYVGGTAQVPPAISIVEGWNLIPAVTLTGAASWDADVYLYGIDWVKAKSWDAAAETWADILPDFDTAPDTSDVNIVSGKGYWLYANAAGVIVP